MAPSRNPPPLTVPKLFGPIGPFPRNRYLSQMSLFMQPLWRPCDACCRNGVAGAHSTAPEHNKRTISLREPFGQKSRQRYFWDFTSSGWYPGFTDTPIYVYAIWFSFKNKTQNGWRRYPEILPRQKRPILSYLEPPISHMSIFFCLFPNISPIFP